MITVPPQRMTDQRCRTILAIQNSCGRGDVVGQRREPVLDYGDAVATARQLVVDATPAGPVGKRAVRQIRFVRQWGPFRRRSRTRCP